MAIIYKTSYENALISVQSLINAKIAVKSSARQIDFSIENKLLWTGADFLKLKAKNKAYDIFHANTERVFQPHWHADAEQRLILQGSGRFYVPKPDGVYIAECTVGDMLWIDGGIVHWFCSDSIITAARFFSENTSHISQTTGISNQVMDYFNEYGDNICCKL